MQPAGKGRDRIMICEDTDGDGRADKFTVFADKLSIPTSLAFANGGVIVHQAPDTLFLKDTDGDDKADVRKVLFTGWGTGDTHAGPSNLRYGLRQLDLRHRRLLRLQRRRSAASSIRFGQGFYRFKPDGSKLEFLRSTNNNSWGVGFSEEGLLFGSTANGCPSVYLPIPNRYYEAVRGWSPTRAADASPTRNRFYPITDKVRQVDWHGGFTAGAGHALYTARTYPKQYWNRTAFVAEPTGHLRRDVHAAAEGQRLRLAQRAGTCWPATTSGPRRSSAEVGPDGNVWVIDWYNYIVQHNPTPAGLQDRQGGRLRDAAARQDARPDLPDRRQGRASRSTPPTLDPSDPAGLVAALEERQHVLAAARPAAAGRAGQDGRGARR